jgi:hypothetical protein
VQLRGDNTLSLQLPNQPITQLPVTAAQQFNAIKVNFHSADKKERIEP